MLMQTWCPQRLMPLGVQKDRIYDKSQRVNEKERLTLGLAKMRRHNNPPAVLLSPEHQDVKCMV